MRFKLKSLSLLSCCLLLSTAIAGTNYAELLEEDSKVIGAEMGPDLLGKHFFDPKSAEYAARVMFLCEMASGLDNFPEISFKDLSEVKDVTSQLAEMDVKGKNNDGIFEAKWKGKEVVLKVEMKTPAPSIHFIRENFILLLINQLGLGPEYYGWVQTPLGKAMLMEKLEGVPLRFDHEDTRKLITRQTMEDYVNIFFILAHAGIFPGDYQLMINQKGRLNIVDVGDYQVWLDSPLEFEHDRILSGLFTFTRPHWEDMLHNMHKIGVIRFYAGDPKRLNLFEEVYDAKIEKEKLGANAVQTSPLDGLLFFSRRSFRESFRRLHGPKG